MGWMPGGLAIAALSAACTFFTALTGASGVTIVAVGGVLYPILATAPIIRETFTLGLLTTSGSRGLLFPPSLPIILYGVVAQIDIAQLIFTAALIPGILVHCGHVRLCRGVSNHQVRERPGSLAGNRSPGMGA